MKYKRVKLAFMVAFVIGLIAGLYLANHELPPVMSPANAALFGDDKSLVSPTKPRERDYYVPNRDRCLPSLLHLRKACFTLAHAQIPFPDH